MHPDLSPADLSVGALVGGQTATLSWTVRNTGSGNAAASWLENVYLSTDSTPDGGDTYLGQVTVSGGLAAGASSAQSLQITVPVTASGNYRILVLSDAGNAVREVAGEANNLASLAVNVGQAPLPDLRVSTISGPSSGLAGRDVTVAYTVSNAGNAPAAGP